MPEVEYWGSESEDSSQGNIQKSNGMTSWGAISISMSSSVVLMAIAWQTPLCVETDASPR